MSFFERDMYFLREFLAGAQNTLGHRMRLLRLANRDEKLLEHKQRRVVPHEEMAR